MNEKPEGMQSSFDELAQICEDADKAFDPNMPREKDPRRITDLLALIKAYWFEHHEMRLGQIINQFNIEKVDIENLEDTALIDEIRNHFDDGKGAVGFKY